MARTAAETASVLSDLYDENFGSDSYEPFRITWPQLRSLAAVPRLTDNYLKGLHADLTENGKALVTLDEFFLIVREKDLAHYRQLPDRLLEQYLPDDANAVEETDGTEDDDVE